MAQRVPGLDPENVRATPVGCSLGRCEGQTEAGATAELTVAAGASRATVDTMLREHMLGRMAREAAFMGRLAEQPAAELEAMVRARQQPSGSKRKQSGVGWTPGH